MTDELYLYGVNVREDLGKEFNYLFHLTRNDTIEEVAQRFEKARDGCSPDDIMGRRWMDSAAELVRSMKK
jgi:hypothetical protein